MARRTIGYHIVKSGYGLWLPGDDRGSWSSAWDELIGLVDPHTLNDGDPVRKRMAQERMKHKPVKFDDAMIDIVTSTIENCENNSQWQIAAASIEPTHTHLMITYSGKDIHTTTKWIADQTTKAIHNKTQHQGPIWAKGKWCSYIFDDSRWNHVINYIEQHNIRRGQDARPYSFITNAKLPV